MSRTRLAVGAWTWLAVGVWAIVGAHGGATRSYSQRLVSSFPKDSDLLRIAMPEDVSREEEMYLISYLAALNSSPTPIIITFLTQKEGKYHVLNLPAARAREM